MIKVQIDEKSNGYLVYISGATVGGEYVYRSVDVLAMLAEIGKLLYGKKVKVQES